MLRASNVRWRGQSGIKEGFCEFDDLSDSIRAVAHLFMYTYRKQGIKTYRQIMCKYADLPFETDSSYMDFLVKTLQVHPDDVPDNFYKFARLLVRIAYYESSFVLDLRYTIYLIHHFKLKIYGKECKNNHP